MQVDLYKSDGQVSGKIELPDGIFAIEPNEHAMHMSVVTYLQHQRQGTRKTKTRTEVSGGGPQQSIAQLVLRAEPVCGHHARR